MFWLDSSEPAILVSEMYGMYVMKCRRNVEEEEDAMKMKNDFREFWVVDLCEK